MAVVSTAQGRVEGVASPRAGGVTVFRGIPFAAPPGGPRRWRPPAPPARWDGVRSAAFGPISPQPASTSGMLTGDPEPQDEDCLYLNVWTPEPSAGAGLPVLVWIHGGSFQSGSGSARVYDGARLAARGQVVVVTLNYRLGVLGWLASEQLGGGNWGLLDQMAALRWLRENVGSFGGDPANVTIFGESAGAISVSTLLGTPAAAGLFDKAIAQSGGPSRTSMRAAERFAASVREAAGVDHLDALRTRPVSDIVAVQEDLAARLGRLSTPMAPVVDGVTLPALPLDAIANGLSAHVPLLAGTNRDEMAYFALGDAKLLGGEDGIARRRLARTAGEEGLDELMDAYSKALAEEGRDAGELAVWVAVESDRMFRIPSLRMAEAQAATGAPVFDYLFDWESPAAGGLLGSCHTLEIPFVFGALDQPAMDVLAGGGSDAQELSGAMMDAWAAFARTGDPSTPELGTWPRYDAKRRSTLRLGRTVEVVEAPMDAQRRAWERHDASRRNRRAGDR